MVDVFYESIGARVLSLVLRGAPTMLNGIREQILWNLDVQQFQLDLAKYHYQIEWHEIEPSSQQEIDFRSRLSILELRATKLNIT
jgi:hypothetical protein